MTPHPGVIDREQSCGVHLPYSRHVDDVTVETRDGLLMRTLRLDGFRFETADTDEINYRAELRDAMLRSVGSSRFALYHHVVRRRADAVLDASFPDAFSRQLDQRWRDRLATRQMYVNDLFLTLVRRPLPGRLGLLERARTRLGGAFGDKAARRAAELQALQAGCEALLSSLGAYRPRLLGIVRTEQGHRSEMLEFLSCLLNGEMRPVGLPYGDIGHYLPIRRLSFGQDAFELGRTGPLERRLGAIVSVKDYPTHTMPGLLDELHRMPFEMTVSQSFGFVERGTALGRIDLALRRMRSAEDDAMSLRDELVQAKDDVASGRAAFGEHHTTIALRAASFRELDGQVADVIASLADLGITGVREDIGLEPAFWSQFPGNFRYVVRRGLVSTANFASLASLHNFPCGQPRGNHWGDAVTLFETTAAGPYYFSFHHNDLGNFTVIGPSGSGKTVVLNFLLAQARKFDPRIVFFDKDRGAELFIRAIGGRYDRLSPNAPSGLNPLQLDDTPANRQFLTDWVALLAGDVDTLELEQIKDAVDLNFSQLRTHRRLRHLADLLRGYARPRAGDLYARLKPWWGEGPRAWLFDNAADSTDLSARTIGLDMTAILDDPTVRTPALLYFFHRVEERLDGTQAIIVIDEGWKALDDDVFVRRIKDWEKTIRKRNGIVGFATQSAEDALSSRIAGAIVEQSATQIFMVNPKARAEDYVGGFGLTSHEFDLVRTLPDTAHCFLVKRGQESVVVRLDLSGEKDLLTILSGREATVRMFDELSGSLGEDPSAWMPPLLAQA